MTDLRYWQPGPWVKTRDGEYTSHNGRMWRVVVAETSEPPSTTSPDWVEMKDWWIMRPEAERRPVDISTLSLRSFRNRVNPERRFQAIVFGFIANRGEEFWMIAGEPNGSSDSWKHNHYVAGAPSGPIASVMYVPAIEWELEA